MQSRSSNGDARSPGGGRAGGITAPTATDFCRAPRHGRGPTGRGAAASGGVLARDGVAPHGCGVAGLTAWHVFSCATYGHATTTCHGTGYGASAPESQAFETGVLVRAANAKREIEMRDLCEYDFDTNAQRWFRRTDADSCNRYYLSASDVEAHRDHRDCHIALWIALASLGVTRADRIYLLDLCGEGTLQI